MLRDITLGQYFPGDTFTHRLDPRTKIISLIFLIVCIFSAKTAVSILLTAALVLFACILFADAEALRAGGSRIGQLSAGIESLQDSNVMLQDEISLRMQHPVLTRMNEQAEAGEETVITISAAPLS